MSIAWRVPLDSRFDSAQTFFAQFGDPRPQNAERQPIQFFEPLIKNRCHIRHTVQSQVGTLVPEGEDGPTADGLKNKTGPVFMSKQGVLIFNPRSGRGKATVRARDFSDHWKARFGTELALRPTRSLADIRVAARETWQPDTVQIFMGGDGTLSESLQGLAIQSHFQPITRPVGFLPGGTGNSFLRDFNILDYKDARDRLLRALEDESIIDVDSGIITYNEINEEEPAVPGDLVQRITFNIWGVELIGEITELAIKMRAIGSLNYTVASVFKMMSHKPWTVTAVIDGQRETFNCNMISVHNSRFTGGAMEIAPDVRINDGRLFLLILKSQNRSQLFKAFPEIFKGTHVNNPHVETRFIEELRLERRRPFLMNVDGELETGWQPRLQIKPRFFRLFMPAEDVKK
ncbi:MAG: hypothetical protein KDK34_20230 [Leptospiraceae bacterium]|nr:hypothetical protein [Leptospiraceae bacterium]